MQHLQITGKALYSSEHTGRYYAIVSDTHYNEVVQPRDHIACTLPTESGPAQAIADGRALARTLAEQSA